MSAQDKVVWKPAPAVSWFLGLELINRLRGIVLDAIQHDFNMLDWMDAREPHDTFAKQPGVWFDFLADIGDGNLAMASIAYHLQRSIKIDKRPSSDPSVSHVDPGRFASKLPATDLARGEFLFIGGDFAYPASDTRTTFLRVIEPFRQARDPDDNTKRPIFGIPANHDYYDDLIGFNRMIRAPLAADHNHAPRTLDGFQQTQHASYVRIRLPHGWELWGLDVGSNGIDFRQLRYFRPPPGTPHAERPEKLIVVTQRPPIVHDHVEAKEAHEQSLLLLRLSTKFEDLAEEPKAELGTHLKCRLDLSGDVHHYARYGKPRATDEAPDAHAFASVVSGGGGAFLHPTDFAGPIPSRKKYPEPEECVRVLSRRLVWFKDVFISGHAWVLAGLIALAIYAGSRQWSGLLTSIPHRLFGSATTPIVVPWPDLAMLGAVLLAIAGPIVWLFVLRPRVVGKVRIAREVADPGPGDFAGDRDSWPKKQSDPSWLRGVLERSPFAGLVWVTLQIVAVIGLIVYPPMCAVEHVPGASMPGVLALLAALFFLAGGIVLAVGVGCGPGCSRLWFFVLGVVHSLIQLTVPLAIMLYASTYGVISIIVLHLVCSALASLLGQRPHEDKRPGHPAGVATGITLLWLVQWLGTIALLAYFSGPTLHQSPTVATGIVAGVVGVVVCVQNFGWYLLVAFLWRGHNNEAGSAIRSEDFKQWIRFHIDDAGVLTGYVIGVDTAVDPRTQVPAARLVDVFQMRPD